MNNNPQIRKYLRRERKLRASYRKRMVVVFILALILGALLGWIANDKLGCRCAHIYRSCDRNPRSHLVRRDDRGTHAGAYADTYRGADL